MGGNNPPPYILFSDYAPVVQVPVRGQMSPVDRRRGQAARQALLQAEVSLQYVR